MSIVRANNFIKRFEDIFDNEFWYPVNSSYTYKGQWVDTDRYDIVPKQSYRKELIAQKEREISELDKRKKELEEEIKSLSE